MWGTGWGTNLGTLAQYVTVVNSSICVIASSWSYCGRLVGWSGGLRGGYTGLDGVTTLAVGMGRETSVRCNAPKIVDRAGVR